jgi:hypothetical protein
MNGQDRSKLKKAGFRVFRTRKVYPINAEKESVRSEIWEISDAGSWCKFSGYESQAAMDRAWKQLMEDDMCVGDQGEI